MNDSTPQTSLVKDLLNRAVAGDPVALDNLLRHEGERLTALAHRMLGRFPGVKRWADTDDVLQNALVRLVSALRDLKPKSSGDFLGLATLQIRRELIDLLRCFHGPHGLGAHHDSQPNLDGTPHDPADASLEPGSLAQWTELHQAIDRLPREQRDVVGLLYYQGLSQAETAQILEISLRTVQRRWHDALSKLQRIWHGETTGG